MSDQSPDRPPEGQGPSDGDDLDYLACMLVVEDDLFLRRVVVRTLQLWGLVILEAADGEAALERVAETGDELGLVLLDIMLPVLDGVEVARRVLKDRPELPIVACSAALSAEVEARLRAVGVRHFLPKPYTADALRDALRLALKPEPSPGGDIASDRPGAIA